MPRPNLSLDQLALTLAALGTSAVIAACSKAEQRPASATSDNAPTASASAAVPPPMQAPPPNVQGKKEEEPSPLVAPGATATATTGAASAAPLRRPIKGSPGGTGQASCGAGNCTAEMKKK